MDKESMAAGVKKEWSLEKPFRRRTTHVVSLDCTPGPPTVLNKEEQLVSYCIKMAEMGFGNVVCSFIGRVSNSVSMFVAFEL